MPAKSQRFRFQPAPPFSQAHPSLQWPQVENYVAAFVVKVLGCGMVLHRSDYGGCQRALDSLAARKKRGKSCVILTITPHYLMITSKKNGKLMLVHKMEEVYVCHPHRSNKRLFGFISESWEPGTQLCYCFSTYRADFVTGADVLQAYNDACRLWMTQSESSKEEKEITHQKEDGNKNSHEQGQPEGEPSASDWSTEEDGNTKQGHTQPKTLKESEMQCQKSNTKGSHVPMQQAGCSESRKVSFQPFVQCHGGIGGMHACSSVPLKGSYTRSSSWVKVMPQAADTVGGSRKTSSSKMARRTVRAEKRKKIAIKTEKAAVVEKARISENTATVTDKRAKKTVTCETATDRGEAVRARKGMDATETSRAVEIGIQEAAYQEKATAEKLQKPMETKESTQTTNRRAPLLAPRNFPPPPPPISKHHPPDRSTPAPVANINPHPSNPPSLLGSRNHRERKKSESRRFTSSSQSMKFPMQLLRRFISELGIATAIAK